MRVMSEQGATGLVRVAWRQLWQSSGCHGRHAKLQYPTLADIFDDAQRSSCVMHLVFLMGRILPPSCGMPCIPVPVLQGLIPIVGAAREAGTSMLIEDVACPVDKLADMMIDLIDMFQRHGYHDASCFGHALEGNLHLVFSQVRLLSWCL